jgi:hypothetical protein
MLDFFPACQDGGVNVTIERRVAKEVNVANFIKERRIL